MAELDQKSDRIPEPMKRSAKLPAPEESPPELSPLEAPAEFIFVDGKRFRVVYQARGAFIRADGKGAYEGIGFIGIVPLE